MHLIESYSLASAAKIEKPKIFEKFFPLAVDKFIVIQPYTKPSKSYDLWADVIAEIAPILSKKGVAIVQIGAKDEKPLRGCYSTIGQTGIGQSAYIISKAMLFLGVDSFGAHVASSYGKKIVCLYANNYLNCVRPFWTKNEDCILLEPDRKDRKPSFSYNENPKTINEIKPEVVAESVCKLLEIEYENKLRTSYVGGNYHNRFIETLPNQILDINQFSVDSLVMRMDFFYNEDALIEQLKRCKCSIITDRPINIDILRAFKSNIKEVIYEIKDTWDVNFVNALGQLNIHNFVISSLKGERLNQLKLDFFDLGNINCRVDYSADIEKIKKEAGDRTIYYKSSKFTLSEGKIYASRAAMLEGQAIESFDAPPQPIVDNMEFWKELEHFKILV